MSNNCATCAFFRPVRKEKPKLEDFPPKYVTVKRGFLFSKLVTELAFTSEFNFFLEEWEQYGIDTSQVQVAKDLFDDNYAPSHLVDYLKALREYHAKGQCYRFPKVEPTNRYYSCGEFQA